MTKKEFSQAYKIAMSDESIDPVKEPMDIFDGFGLMDFKPVYVTLKQVARLIRYQAVYLNGGIDTEALQDVAVCGKKKFLII